MFLSFFIIDLFVGMFILLVVNGIRYIESTYDEIEGYIHDLNHC